MQKRQVLLTIVCLLLLGTGLLGIDRLATAQDQTRDVAFNTPEEVITFYMEGVAQGDVSRITQVCAVNEMSEGFNFELCTNRLRALEHSEPGTVRLSALQRTEQGAVFMANPFSGEEFGLWFVDHRKRSA